MSKSKEQFTEMREEELYAGYWESRRRVAPKTKLAETSSVELLNGLFKSLTIILEDYQKKDK
jgi:hypothetical protein